MQKPPVVTEQQAAFLHMVANPYRLRVLQLLAKGEMTVGDLVEKVGLSQSALSQHLARLRESGLVKTRRDAQMVYYAVKSEKVYGILEALERMFPTAGGSSGESGQEMEKSANWIGNRGGPR